jgi:hypothetical protein
MLVNEDATEPSSWLRSQSRMRGFTKMVRAGATGVPTVAETVGEILPPPPIPRHAVESIHLRERNTGRWNGVTVGLLSSVVDTMSRCQPMHPTKRLSKKPTLSGKLRDMLTWTVLATSDIRSKKGAGSSTVNSSMAICLLERWSGKGPDSVIGDALFGTDIPSSQHRYPPMARRSPSPGLVVVTPVVSLSTYLQHR